jgi:lipoprotein-anchoring transpeptidase ErfK/SrfK
VNAKPLAGAQNAARRASFALAKIGGRACLAPAFPLEFGGGDEGQVMLRKIVFAGAFLLAAFAGPRPASADVIAEIELSSQRMIVKVDGLVRHVWAVSTARQGYATPTGSFRPVRLERMWYSTIYHGSPMPYAIFFNGNFAVHGTYETASLGRPASHGCVRLLPANARALFDLVRQHGFERSRIVVGG